MKIIPSLILSFILVGLWSCSDAGDPLSNGCTEGLDCAGECGGDAVDDACGTCEGSITDATQCDCPGGTVRDCAGECGGDAVDDCSGVCGGSTITDDCNVCGGDNSSCVNFSTEIQAIFDANCTPCHITSIRNNLSLSNYANSTSGNSTNGPVIVLGDHANSLLWQKVNSGSMPPSGQLTSGQINLIATWIDEGARDN